MAKFSLDEAKRLSGDADGDVVLGTVAWALLRDMFIKHRKEILGVLAAAREWAPVFRRSHWSNMIEEERDLGLAVDALFGSEASDD